MKSQLNTLLFVIKVS